MSKSSPLYQSIVDDIEAKIHHRELVPGNRIYSINDLCNFYQVSTVTAVRALNELKQKGLITTINGKGSFIADVLSSKKNTLSSKKVEQVVILIGNKQMIRKDAFFGKIALEIVSEAAAQGLPSRYEFKNFETAGGNVLQPIEFNNTDGVISLGAGFNLRSLTVAKEKAANTVIVDTFLPNYECVITDNYYGMQSALEYLKKQGHKNVICASRFSKAQNHLNENQRGMAFKSEIDKLGLTGKVILGNDFNELTKLMNKKKRPTAFVFTQDDPALIFISILKEKGFSVPEDISVVGFDNFAVQEKGLDKLTTVAINLKGLAKEAFKILMEPVKPLWFMPEWQLVKPKLIIRESTGKVH